MVAEASRKYQSSMHSRDVEHIYSHQGHIDLWLQSKINRTKWGILEPVGCHDLTYQSVVEHR